MKDSLASCCSSIFSYSHFFSLKKIRLPITITTLTMITTGYPYTDSSSGIYRKFMPYHPASKVSGIKIVVMDPEISQISLPSFMVSLYHRQDPVSTLSRRKKTVIYHIHSGGFLLL